ncbi:flagellar biosynthesis protein FlgA [Phytohabitans rumicis]|uniref:SAF domain-containing protein n=1 Tax=Phytohabitans rumicis TaxID=1076125 RepID=A0A6V8L850_9ACTN|nr:flagellar biosynthesis protein FlgA [Phytohabitans rumicis]GFJ91168.1 hypothetical protein Prum_048100 [Phytohabitans rumicis]
MRDPKLDPVRRPRGRTLFRLALVAALLLTAVGVLYAREPARCLPAVAQSTPPPTVDAGGRLAVPADAVGVPVRLAEPALLGLVRAGDQVDLLASSALVAPRALVLGVVGADGAILLALTPERARAVVGLPEGTRFGILVRPG